MTEYFKDLTYYSLHQFENAQNIGWINGSNEFHKGEVPSEVVDNLWSYTKHPFHEQRGQMSSMDSAASGLYEIRVISADGSRKYAAPNSIIHYVKEHGYCPPVEFMKAVMDGPKPGSREYQAYVQRYTFDCLWGETDDTVAMSEKLSRGILNNDRHLIHRHAAQCNIITRNGSLLSVAIKSRNLQLAQDLIEFGADVNKFSGIELNQAVMESENDIVALLLSHNILMDVSAPKRNPLFTAIRKGNIEAVRLLLEKGIDAKIQYTNEFMRNMDAFAMAKRCKQEAIVELLDRYV